MHRWGYAPTLETLANELVGGPSPVEQLRETINGSSAITFADDFVCLRGQEHLLTKSRDRERTNRVSNGHAKALAEEFARNLVRTCPFVDCVALSGSVASGGYIPTDDIDFDIFVQDGAKYLTYAVSLALGLRFSLRHAGDDPFRKIICINVVWTRNQTSPFERKDADLAFELLHCRPLIGAKHFYEVIRRNTWVETYFPQLAEEQITDLPRPKTSFLGKVLGRIASDPRLLELAERVGRAASLVAYSTTHWLRRNDREAMQRLAFLQRVKYPYEVFQD